MNLKELARKAVSTLFLSMLCLVAFAQTATGLVKDKTGEPMIGVNVLVKGTTNGTITDFDGKFSIPDVPSNATLVVSYIGYLTKEVKTGKDLVIVLEEDNKTLDEVVVIGYGTVKRRDLTGSVASVTGEKLAANPVANVAQALQGQLPGVSVTSQDGRPGAGMSIRICGGGSITQSNDPLFIVDGVQVSGIDDIPADNIESIDVLKDAASTAIYGARGANGVILVTTKGGKDGRVSVKYNMYYQMKENPKLLETMDPYDYVYNTWAYMKSLGDSYGDGVARYFGLGSKYGNHLNEYKNMTTHNYINDLMQTASSWNHDVSLSGGTDKTKFYSSVNYMDDEGIRVKSGFQRWNANFKLTQKINKKLTADFDLRYSEIEVNGSGFGNATSAYTYRPVDNPLGDASFTAGFGQGDTNMEETSNPLYYLNTVDYIKNMYRIRAKGALTWNVIKGLTAKTELSLNRNWNQEKTWNAGQTEKDNSSAKLKKSDGYGVRWATTLNYEVQGLGDDHSLSFLVGNEVLASKSDYTEIYGVGYPKGFTMDDAFGMINMTTPSLGQDYFKGEIGTPNHTLSWFGRANYSYKGKYLLTATFRADGSSKFAPSHQWGYFPAAAAAWRISDEAFMENTRDWLDNLKVRLSYGTVGNDGISSDLWSQTWTSETDLRYQYILNNQYSSSYDLSTEQMANKNLKWETTITRNLGFDFGFLKNRLWGSLDLYWNTTKDLLMLTSLPGITGFTSTYDNIGQTSNKGIEFSLSGVIYENKDWNITAGMNINFNKGKVDKLAENVTGLYGSSWCGSSSFPGEDYILQEGKPVGMVRGFIYDGFYTTDDFNYVNGQYILKEGVADLGSFINPVHGVDRPSGQNAYPGLPKFKDMDNSGGIDEKDVTIIGDMNPVHTGGFNINTTYKNFDLGLYFNWSYGNDVYNVNKIASLYGAKEKGVYENKLGFMKDSYKIYDVVDGKLVRLTTPEQLNAANVNANLPLPYSENGVTSSIAIEDGSYLRLNTLTLGYSLPDKVLHKAGLSKLRIYGTIYNLFTLTGYSGLDPEVSANTSQNKAKYPTVGLDWGTYPRARSFVVGLNLAF